MDMLFTLLTITLSLLIFMLLAWSLLVLSCYIGKSMNDRTYPPVKGTVIGQLFHFKRLHDYFTEIAKTNQTFRLVAPDHSELYTTDVQNIEHILKTNFDGYTKGQYNRDIASDLFGEGIFAADGDKWKQQRKLASYELNTRALKDFSFNVFRKHAVELVRVVSEFSHAGLDFDVQDLMMRCALDSMFKVGFGVELNCLGESNNEGREFMKAFDDSNAIIYWRYVDPTWKLKRFLNIGQEAILKKNVKFLDGFVHGLIKTRRDQLETRHDYSDKKDILSRFLMESKKEPEKMNDKYLRDITLNFLFAGKDSSGNTLSWFFYMLCKNPQVQERIFQEVKDVTCSQESGQCIEGFVDSITNSALENMHYLHAALTETMRLYPVAPMDGKMAETHDILPDGYKVKKGDAVFYMPYAMGRMTYIWGDDAEDFRPERWLKDGVFQPKSPFKFIAFNAGPRVCLGKDYAYRQMKIVSMALVYFFRFKLANETRDVTYRTMFTLLIDKGLPLCAFPRDWTL